MASSSERRVAWGRLMWVFIRAGWNPPVPSPRVAGRILDDLEGIQPQATLRLTPMHRRILELLSSGHTRGEIATELGVAHETVKEHLQTIYRRLGARNAPHAVAIYLGRDLPPSDEPD